MIRWLRRILMGVLVVIALAAGGGAILGWALLPARDSSVDLPGLSAPVAVRFDADGIPYIRAGSDRDAAEALGYVHARDRMFQMELMRRLGSGTLSALLGPGTLSVDEEMRKLDLRGSARADVADLSPDAKGMLAAYAAGVNAWISSRGRLAGPEFVVLGRPAPWTITDSLLYGKEMGLWLSGNWQVEASRLALSAKIPPAKIMALWPPAADALPEAAAVMPMGAPALAQAAAAMALGIARFPQNFTQPVQASNEWAVAGGRTASGKPLLAGDPHLGFGFPCLWYLVRIDTPTGTLAGASAPGIPFLVIGHNAHLAWTFTTTGAAVQDVFIEHASADGKTYATPTGATAFVTRTERIMVRGQPDVVITVQTTRHGPVMGKTPDGKNLLAVAMANLAPHDTDSDGLLALNRAQSVDGAATAAALITSPVQNLLTADTGGKIGFYTTGRVPVRKAGDGTWPVDGADGAHDWTGILTSASLPRAIDPPGGMLVNANNPTVGADFPVFLTRDTYPSWRAARIRALLHAAPPATAAIFAAMQLDITSDYAQRLLPSLTALNLPSTDPAAAALNLLRDWHGEMTMDRPQPLIFNAWIFDFVLAVLRQNGVDEATAPVLDDSFALSLLSPAGAAMWCGGDCGPALKSSLEAAVTQLQSRYGANPETWRWGSAHHAVFAHPLLGRLAVIGALGRFSIEAPGDATTIDAAGPYPTPDDPDDFTAVHGPELRGVYDLADLDQSLFIIGPGESGNLLSSHADDLLTRWRDGGTIQLGPQPGAVTMMIRMLGSGS